MPYSGIMKRSFYIRYFVCFGHVGDRSVHLVVHCDFSTFRFFEKWLDVCNRFCLGQKQTTCRIILHMFGTFGTRYQVLGTKYKVPSATYNCTYMHTVHIVQYIYIYILYTQYTTVHTILPSIPYILYNKYCTYCTYCQCCTWQVLHFD